MPVLIEIIILAVVSWVTCAIGCKLLSYAFDAENMFIGVGAFLLAIIVLIVFLCAFFPYLVALFTWTPVLEGVITFITG